IVDIGGGTTDMLASYGREFRQGSINIAGDIFTRRSIVYSTARKASAGRKTHPGTEELQTMFHYNGTATEVPIAYYQTYEIKINNLQYEYPNFPPLSADGMRTKYYDMAELLDSLMQVPGIIPAFSNVTNAETLMESGILRTQAEASISLSETIKLRYMQLFYLLANWLKANRDMFKYDEMDHIRIFFAGYGVRGLGFCAGQDVMTFALDNKFLHLLKLLMQAVLETEKDIVFIQPQVTDKVEVVKGLLSSQELRRDDQLRKKSDRAPISRITEVDKKKITAAYHEIAKIFDIVFEKFNSEQNDGMGLFCERFTGLLQKAEKVGMKHEAKWLGILSELPTIFEASRRAKLSGDLSHVGAAVWGFNRALDFATAHWEATEE
ncbi:MAG: hypothetical protein FWH55_10950, partial [Oscillospiraceae bacterium]|nr:hypothetical protein [Oscillospiraceae bacterium]